MKLVELDADAFGVLRKWSASGLDTDSGVVLFVGPNESGKTTAFHLVECLLYGFSPADPAKHPFVPWDGAVLSIKGRFRLDGGDVVTISRRLKARPEGFLEIESLGGGGARGWIGAPTPQPLPVPERLPTPERLENREVPFVKHVPRAIFRQVYALTLDDLNMPEDRVWGEVEDHLLGSFTPKFLKPARLVAADLLKDASNLWRPDARGSKSVDKVLTARIRELNAQRKDAKDRDEAIRSNVENTQALKEKLQQLKQRKVELEATLRRVNRLNPVRSKWRRIQTLRSLASGVESYADVPDDPLRRIEDLEKEGAEAQEALEKLKKELEALGEKRSAYTDAHRAVISESTRIRDWIKRSTLLVRDNERLRDLTISIVQTEERVKNRVRELISGEWSREVEREIENRLKSLSAAELRMLISDFRGWEERYSQAAARTEGIRARTEGMEIPAVSGMTLVIAIAGAAILVLGAMMGTNVLVWAGTGVAVFGVSRIWSTVSMRRAVLMRREKERTALAEALRAEEDLQKKKDEAASRLRAFFSGIPIIESYLERPDDTLIAQIAAVQRDLSDLDMLREQRSSLMAEMESSAREIAYLASVCGVKQHPAFLDAIGEDEALPDLPDLRESRFEALPSLITAMETALLGAERAREGAERAEERMSFLEGEIAALREKIGALDRQKKTLVERLRAAGNGDPELGARLISEKRKAERDATTLEEDLQREFHDLDATLSEIEGYERDNAEWIFTDEEVVRMESELADVVESITKKEKELVSLEKDLENLLSQPTLSFIEGEIEALEEERAQARRRRDRLVLLRAFVLEADRRYKEEHQPDIFRRASKYIELITGGRYHRITLDGGEEDKDRKVLSLHSPDLGYSLGAAPPLSRGTLDQVYLALRLALVEHLDAGGERLPVFLDEVLVNWDGVRRAKGIEVLKEIARYRQVLIFTCHDHIARELVNALGAVRVDLPSGS
ncbi:MAG TPA: AAA family ATPase [Clostridia bacterium]|nr:AAA family ATPase [Clostridia bacterium]